MIAVIKRQIWARGNKIRYMGLIPPAQRIF